MASANELAFKNGGHFYFFLKRSISLERQILENFAQPSKTYDVQIALGVFKPEFTKAINKLINAKKIKGQSKSSKKWCAISGVLVDSLFKKMSG